MQLDTLSHPLRVLLFHGCYDDVLLYQVIVPPNQLSNEDPTYLALSLKLMPGMGAGWRAGWGMYRCTCTLCMSLVSFVSVGL